MTPIQALQYTNAFAAREDRRSFYHERQFWQTKKVLSPISKGPREAERRDEPARELPRPKKIDQSKYGVGVMDLHNRSDTAADEPPPSALPFYTSGCSHELRHCFKTRSNEMEHQSTRRRLMHVKDGKSQHPIFRRVRRRFAHGPSAQTTSLGIIPSLLDEGLVVTPGVCQVKS